MEINEFNGAKLQVFQTIWAQILRNVFFPMELVSYGRLDIIPFLINEMNLTNPSSKSKRPSKLGGGGGAYDNDDDANDLLMEHFNMNNKDNTVEFEDNKSTEVLKKPCIHQKNRPINTRCRKKTVLLPFVAGSTTTTTILKAKEENFIHSSSNNSDDDSDDLDGLLDDLTLLDNSAEEDKDDAYEGEEDSNDEDYYTNDYPDYEDEDDFVDEDYIDEEDSSYYDLLGV